jgi:septum formation protein
MRLLLCSASPRRRDLLAGLGLVFEVLAPQVDESRRPGEPLAQLPERLACDKALAGLALRSAERLARAGGSAVGDPRDAPEPLVALAADTVVTLDGQELGKPVGRAQALDFLRRLSGREHLVTTGVCAVSAEGALRSCSVNTKVRFSALSEAQLDWLAASGDGDDKAGGYGLQGKAGAFVERLDGSFSNVIGLPLAETLGLLEAAGLPLPWREQRR